jgi:hypothetical protein
MRARVVRALEVPGTNLNLVKSGIAVDKAVGDTFAANNIQIGDALPAFK